MSYRTIDQTARLLGITPDEVRLAILSDQLRASYSNGKFRIGEHALVSYLKTQGQGAAA